MPWPVMASVTTARTKPIMAARPLSSSLKAVKPWGIFSAMTTVAGRRAGTAEGAGRRAEKEEAARAAGERARTGAAETKAGFILGAAVEAVEAMEEEVVGAESG